MAGKFVIAVCAIVAFSTVVPAVAFQRPPKWHQLTADYSFEQYMQDFHKPYTTGSIEWFESKGLFEASLKRILVHNADASQSYKKGVNQFTDLTEDERRVRTSMVAFSSDTRSAAISDIASDRFINRNVTPPESKSVDYRTSVPPVLTTVKDQGFCGSCWSFGTTEAIETHYALKFGKLHVLSEQQLVSCAPKITTQVHGTPGTTTMGGCQGYFPQFAFDYLVSQGGVMTTEWMNPYTSYWSLYFNEPVAKCKKTVPGGDFVNVTDYNFVEANNMEAYKQTLQKVGPVTIAMFVPKSFREYESGVYAGAECIGNTQMQPSHIVLLVGYGHDPELKKDYWIVRNSWGTAWGEDGYFRLLREASQTDVNAACGAMPLPAESQKSPDGIVTLVNTTACGTCGILATGVVPTVGV